MFGTLSHQTTPCLVLDHDRLDRNVARLRGRLAGQGVQLRPHLKTAKSWPVAQLLMDTPRGPATVSTLAEAEAFAAFGVRDLIYAVGLAPQKLVRVVALRRQGVDIKVLVDSRAGAEAVAAASAHEGALPALVEVACDGHRGGVAPESAELLEIGGILEAAGDLAGVLAHAGASYGLSDPQALAEAAEAERAAAVRAAERLRAEGWAAPIVSVGSTPTALSARDLSGVTEVRAGVFAFFDLVQAGIGVCGIDDIALSVLSTVIGHTADGTGILIDAGWMALSRDRGTAGQAMDQGFGLVCDLALRPLGDLIVSSTSQEHGTMTVRPGSGGPLPELQVGDLVRILPNHACATAAQHEGYHVVRRDEVVEMWPRLRGW